MRDMGNRLYLSILGVVLLVVLSACDLFNPGLGARVDISPPVTRILSPSPNSYINTPALTIHGTTTDDLGIASLTARIRNSSGALVKEASTLPGSDGTWSLSFDTRARGTAVPDYLPDGEYSIEVLTQDGRGRTHTTYTTVFVDTRPPTVLITNPLTKSGDPGYSASHYTDAVDIKGEVFDYSPVSQVWVTVIDGAGNEVLGGKKLADGTHTWTVRFYLAGLVDDKTYRIKAEVLDLAGNRSSYFFHRQDILLLKLPEKPFPSMAELGRVDQDGALGSSGITFEGLAGRRIALDQTARFPDFIYDADPTLIFDFINIDKTKGAEENLVSPKSRISGSIIPPPLGGAVMPNTLQIVVRERDGAATTVATIRHGDPRLRINPVGSALSYSFDLISDGRIELPPAAYRFTVLAETDGNIRKESDSFEFFVDSEAPFLEVSFPTAFYLKDDFRIRFNASHAAGLEKLTVETKYKDGPFVVEQEIPLDGVTQISAGESGLIRIAPQGDGLYNYRLTLHTRGGKTAAAHLAVHHDTTAPTLTVQNPTSGAIVEDTLTLSGVASDGNGSGAVELRYSVNGGSSWTSFAPGGINWHRAGIALGAEGAKELLIYAVDALENASAPQTIPFFHDSGLPSISGINIPPGSTAYRSGSYEITGTASDSSGLASVRIERMRNGGAFAHVVGSPFAVAGTSAPWSYTHTVDPAGSDDGEYTYRISAWDNSGRSRTESRVVRVDTQGPSTIIRDPGPFVAGISFAFTGTASDGGGSGVKLVEYRINGGPWQIAGGSTNWIASVDLTVLSEGTHTIEARGIDLADLVSPVPSLRSFMVDQGSPTATATDPTGASGVFSLSGTATDPNGIQAVMVTQRKDGGVGLAVPVVLGPDLGTRTWTAPSLPSGGVSTGTYTYTIVPVDRAGRTGAPLTRTVAMDFDPPLITAISDPAADGALIFGSTYTVRGNAADSGPSGLRRVEYSLDGASTWLAALGTGSWNFIVDLAALGEGAKSVVVRAIDNADNRTPPASYMIRSFTVDQHPPALAETGIGTTSLVYRGSVFALSGTLSDSNGLQSLTVTQRLNGALPVTVFSDDSWASPTAEGTPWDLGGLPRNPTSPADTLLAEGHYEYTITGVDKAGRTANLFRAVRIDRSPPVLTVSRVRFGAVERFVDPVSTEPVLVESGVVELVGSVSDGQGSGVDSLSYSLNGIDYSPITLSGTNWSASLDFGAAQGLKHFWVRARDRLGFESIVGPVPLMYDSAPPTLSENSIGTTGKVHRTASYDLRFISADGNRLKTLTVERSTDGGTIFLPLESVDLSGSTSSDITRTYAVNALTHADDGPYLYRISVEDVAGRRTTITRSVLVDTRAPTATIQDPGTFLSGNSGTLHGTATDGIGSGLSWVRYSTDNMNWTGTIGTDTWLLTLDLDTDGPGPDAGLAEGSHTLFIQTLDRAGNPGLTISRTFVVDQAPPTLAFYRIDGADFADEVLYRASSASLSGTAVDTNGVQAVALTQTGVGAPVSLPVSLGAGTSSRSWTAAAPLDGGEGTYTIVVTITDAAGRTASVSRTIVKDTAAPNLPTVVNPASAGLWISGSSYVFSGTASDMGAAGIAAVYLGSGARGLTPPEDVSDPFWTRVSGTSSWNGAISLSGEGERALYLKARDRAGNRSGTASFTFGIDQNNPTVSIVDPPSYIAGTFTLGGTAEDTNGVVSVTVSERRPGQGIFDAPLAASYNPATRAWSFTRTFPALPDGTLPDGTYEYRVTVLDLAGKTAVSSRTVTLDRTSPTLTLNQPSPHIFSGGILFGNGTVNLSGSAGDAGNLSGLELKVGGADWVPFGASPYTSFSFVFDTTTQTDKTDVAISVRARDRAGNATVSSWTIRVDQDTDKPTVAINSPAEGAAVGAIISVSGSVSDDDGLSAAADTVQYQVSDDGGGTWTPWTNAASVAISAVSRSYSFEFTPASDGAKQFRVRAQDSNGVFSNVVQRTVQRDTGSPIINISPPSPAYGSIRNGDFTVAGTATDTSGIVASVRYRVLVDGAETVPFTDMIVSGGGTGTALFSATISTAAGTGTYQVIIRTVDNFGNARELILSVSVDKTPPVPAFSFPVGASTLNNRVSLSGTASDNLGLASVNVAIVKGGSIVGTPLGASGTHNWSIVDFDTSIYGNTTFGTLVSGTRYSVTLRVIATDTAGNVGSRDLTVFIDQETDKPIITFMTASSPAYIGTGQIVGAAVDDDGISEIAVSVNGGAFSVLPGGGWTQNSTWSHTLPPGDGAAAMRVRVRDSSSPFIESISPVTIFNIDTENPDITFAAPAANAVLRAGQLTFSGTFADESSVVSVRLKADSGDFSSGDVKTVPITVGVSGTWTYTFSSADLADGLRTIYLQAVDAAGRTTTVNRTVVVDKTPPTVVIAEPVSGSAAFGLTRIRGTASDAVSALRSVRIGLGKTINAADWDHPSNVWYPAAGTVSWSYTITNINSFANTTYATDLGDTNGNGVTDPGETWQNIWRLFIYLRAEDSAGNVAVVDTYFLEVDPLRDRPEILILQPVDQDSVVGGFLRIVGFSHDTNHIAKNQIAFDLNDNGFFNDPGDLWPSAPGFVPPPVDGTDLSTTAWYAMTGTTSWSQVINGRGEFNPSGAATTRPIRFKVRAVDSKVAHGGAPDVAGLPAVYRVTFSNAVPQFSTLSLATGDTVGGSNVRLTGRVKVPSDIRMNQIFFRHEGPRISSSDLIGGTPGMRAVLLNPADAGYEASYDTYSLDVSIDTTAADLFQNNAGTMTVSLWAEDTKFFRSIQSISLNVDNRAPTNLAYTGYSEIIGSQAEIQGEVRDTGAVSGIRRIVFFLQRGTGVLRLKGGSGTLPNGGGQVLDLANAAYDDYRIVIDNRLEDGNDTGSAGDRDGFREWLTISAGTFRWAAQFDSTLISDGRVSLRYMAEDLAGNTVSGVTEGFVANNKPIIQSFVLGTELDGVAGITGTERTPPFSSGYASTGFTARNNLLLILINAIGGNGTRRYSVTHNGIERNTVLTGNSVVIDTSLIPDSLAPNDRSFVIRVYDSTTSDDNDQTDELYSTVTVNLTIKNMDSVAPLAAIDRFFWRSQTDNSLFANSQANGHIELEADLPESLFISGAAGLFDRDPKVSGMISVRGSAYDETRLSGLYLFLGDGGTTASFTFPGAALTKNFGGRTYARVAAYSGGIWSESDHWATQGWRFTVIPDFLNQEGHRITWRLDLDTSRIGGVAALDRLLRVVAEDSGAGPNASAETEGTYGSPRYRMDIVPYVASVSTPKRNLGGLRDINIRSSGGAYSIIQGTDPSFITVSGFNLNPGAVRIVPSNVVSSTAVGPASGIALAHSGIDTAGFRTFTLSNNSSRSGYLELFVNGVRALNNVNNNAAGGTYAGSDPAHRYNLEADPHIRNNLRLNDDRYLRFFRMLNTGVRNGLYPDMVMEGNNPVFGFVNLSGGPGTAVGLAPGTGAGSYRPTNAMPQRARFDGSTGAELTTEYLVKGLIWDQMAMARDDANRYYHVSVYNYDGARMGLFYDRYAELYTGGQGWGDGPAFVGYTGNRVQDAGNNALSLEATNFDVGLLLGRYQYPKLIARGNSITAHARVYMLYYDDNTATRDLIFRNFRIGPDVTGTGTVALFSGGTSSTGQAYNQRSNLADGDTAGRITAASNASRHFDFAVTAGNRVIVVYYDEFDGRLKLRYSSGPVDGSNPTAPVAWTDSSAVFPDYVGRYVSMTLDSSGGVHIAAFDAAEADLVYLYLESFTSTVLRRVTVDSAFSVGSWTNIRLRESGGTIVPYIAYYNSSENGGRDAIKLAYSLSGITTSNVPAGVDSGGFVTGHWETLTVPALTPPQGGSLSFKQVNLDFDSAGRPVLGYLGTNLEFGYGLDE